MLLLICIISFFSALCGQSDVSRVFFKQADGACVFRNVYDPHGYFKAYTVASGLSFYVTGHLASEEIYDYVISLQKRFPELPQIPIIVCKIPSQYFTHCCFVSPSYRAICYFDVTIDDMPLDWGRKFFLGHELGHFAYSATHSFYSYENNKSRWWIGNANWCQGLLFMVGCAIAGACTAQLLLGEDASWWGKKLVGCVVLSGIVRAWGHSISGSCHEEELYCDAFALKTARNDREKKLLLGGAKKHFLGCSSRWGIIKDSWASVVSTSTHPSDTYRIKMLETECSRSCIH